MRPGHIPSSQRAVRTPTPWQVFFRPSPPAWRRTAGPLLFCSLLLLSAVLSPAQTTLYWDVDGTTAGAGGTTPTGNWRTSGAGVNWGTAADGTSATALWTNNSIAVFSAGADATGSFTVTVNTVSANSILIEEGNITFASSTITLTGTTPSVTVASGLTATFSSGLAGTNGFVKEGAGTVIFQSTGKNFTGDATINAGTLRLGAGNMIGNAVDVHVATGATFDLNGFNDSFGSLSGAGSITLGSGTLTTDGDGETTQFSGVISGTGALAKTGTDTLILSGANTYSGTTAVSGGILNIRHSSALGSTAAGTTITSGEELQLQGNIAVGAEALSLTGTGASGTGALRNAADTNSYAGLITLAGNTTVTADAGSLTLSGGFTGSSNLVFRGAGDITVSGAIATGAGSITKLETGTLILSGANTYTGATTVGASGGTSGGTLRLGASDVLSGNTTTVYAGTLDLNGFSDTIGALALGSGASGTTAAVTTGAGTLTLGGNITYTSTNNPNAASISGRLDLGGTTRTFTIGDSTAATHDLTVSAIISGSGGLTKQGNGTLVLSGANTYDGATAVSAGVLNIQHSSALGSTAAGTTVTSGDELQLQGGIAVGAEALSIAGSGTDSTGALRNISGDNSWAGAVTLTNTTQIYSDAGRLTLSGGITAANRNLTLAGAGDFSLGALTTGTGTLTKNGAGTATLTGTNTYTGATTINTGTLRLGASDSLADTMAVTVAAGATFDVNGHTDTIGTLAGTGGTVDIGSGALTTAGNSSTTFSGVLTGDGSFTKAGTGVLTLDSTTDFAFDGTFNLAGGTLRLTDLALTLGTLNLTGNSTIDFTGVSSLSVTQFNITGAFTLTILNWVNASDYFFAQNWTGAVFDTTGSSPMNQVTFNGATNADTKWLPYDHQVTPVPEPATYGALLLGVLTGLFAWRRLVRRPAFHAQVTAGL